ncbi:response regulator transcription factor [Paenibacillus sp. CAA11]|uniref:response regulator transcription factor n=1 Tax=Paenibacillus sp. CAA11 TaxID=1532905 RepID=UPI00131F0BA1|nr:response regulator transcription factor [Paenibacillus sp. CAA11]
MEDYILFIKDTDPTYAYIISRKLAEQGLAVLTVDQTEQVQEQLRESKPIALLLAIDCDQDIRLRWLAQFRREANDILIPVIVVERCPSTTSLTRAFEAGADDYLGKGAPVEELAVRLRHLHSLFRRMQLDELSVLAYEDLRIRLHDRKVYRGEELIKLTPKEYELLVFLVHRVHRVCSREVLLQEVWGYEFNVETNVVDVYIRHLRGKIDRGRSRKLIHTVRGTGYLLE